MWDYCNILAFLHDQDEFQVGFEILRDTLDSVISMEEVRKEIILENDIQKSLTDD